MTINCNPQKICSSIYAGHVQKCDPSISEQLKENRALLMHYFCWYVSCHPLDNCHISLHFLEEYIKKIGPKYRKMSG